MSRTDKADWKIVWIFCGMLAVCSLLMMRIYLLSMSSGLQQAAAEQSSYTLTVTTTRGRIYDRRMQPLTDTEQHDLIAVLPTAQAAQDCAKQIEGTARRAALDRIAQGTPFLLDITGKDGEREKVYSQDVENITTAARLPHDPTEQRAVHLLGYRDSEGKGLTGIERAFDSRLEKAGEPVRVRCQVDALGRALEQGRMQLEGNAHPPKDGVVLTLDSRMQQIVEQVGSQIDRGAVVVMEVDSGELIACASFPSYDPYRLESALKDERKPLINRALMPYCVGSSFKLAVAAAALEQRIPPSFSVNCVGGTTVAGRIFYCHNHAGHRQTNLRRAIEQSCNPYFIRLGQKAGAQALLGMAQALGFGQETVLAEGITARQGTLPSLEELSSPHELANFSFGQGKLTATPVQVAAMVSAVANGGLAVSPKLVLGSTTDGSTLEPQQQTAPVRVFSERTAQILREDMIGVVEQGSATMAKPQQGGAGGKTASAQTGILDEDGEEVVHAWFAGFFPAQQPRYAAVVLIEGGEYGGQVASPIFRQIVDRYGPLEPEA